MPVPEHILEKIIVKKKRAKICALKFKRIPAGLNPRWSYFLISLCRVLRFREGLYFFFSTFSCVLRKLRVVM